MKLERTRHFAGFALVAAVTLGLCISGAQADVVTGPVYPLPGGNGFSATGSTDGHDNLTPVQTATYTINTPAAFSELYWAPLNIQATMNGTLSPMNSVTIDGLTATWTGSTSVADQFNHTSTVLMKFVATIDQGASGWLPSLTLATPTTSISPLAFAQLTTGNFVVKEQFLASLDGTNYSAFAPLFNSIHEPVPNGGLERTSFGGGFYYVSAVPEASTWAMLVLGFAGVGFAAYRQRSPSHQRFRLA